MDNTLSKDMNSNSISNSNSTCESKVSSPCPQDLRRRKRELGRAKHEGEVNGVRRRRLQMFPGGEGESSGVEKRKREKKEGSTVVFWEDECPKFAHTSVCGRRRYMEDFVAIHPSICSKDKGDAAEFHYFAVYDGHGCSHVANWCKKRLHEVLKEELAGKGIPLQAVEWKEAMERSFGRVDNEVIACKEAVMAAAGCRCLLPSWESDAVGSTAVVALVTPDQIVVANCGDSRAVLSRKGRAIPITVDQKPDRPDELARIQAAGGRVIYFGGARVLGILAMSRAIGDKFLKPYVISKPEVTIINRTTDDDCLILASDGLWDMVSNQAACCVARMCLDAKVGLFFPLQVNADDHNQENTDKACEDASVILTKLALIRDI